MLFKNRELLDISIFIMRVLSRCVGAIFTPHLFVCLSKSPLIARILSRGRAISWDGDALLIFSSDGWSIGLIRHAFQEKGFSVYGGGGGADGSRGS